MKLDQLCVYCGTEDDADDAKVTLGLQDAVWVRDEVLGYVSVKDRAGNWTTGVSEGILQFNYDTGMEYELLTYTSGPNWHDLHNLNQERARIGHVGYHLEDGEEFPEHWQDLMVQEMFTSRHSNPKVLEAKRNYHYRIYDTVDTLGYYSKVIRRLGPDTSYPSPLRG